MLRWFGLFFMISFFIGCTEADQRIINRALHDANVELKRDVIRQKCQSGYYVEHYGFDEHRRQCGYDYELPKKQIYMVP